MWHFYGSASAQLPQFFEAQSHPIVSGVIIPENLVTKAYSKLLRRTLTGELDVRGASSGKPGRYAHASLALRNSQQTQIYEDIRMYYGTYKQCEKIAALDRSRNCMSVLTLSLRKLKHKVQRTGYRLALVKSYSMAEVDNNAELINIGQPDFIEVKTVTHCGNGDYALASEHAHSNCVLIAWKKICRDGVWHTWIDDERFHELIAKYYEDGTPFTADDYTAPTPYWAVYDTKEQGFDPVETRFRRTKDGKVVEFAYQSTESGCV
ncbi:hypothetical protein JG688_00017458 [Phytophthora aleatoria]|uniref:Uncharacterized protein n=1 Tax=Phytophthora aleatoria TaxID=2496075 RepID=A0A8J5IX53_9STRA|nr:hypothetical protein JG688_00017458 [Phytophthora aleatoria]